MNNENLFGDFQSDLQAQADQLKRRRELARQLVAKAMTPGDQGQMVSGIYVPSHSGVTSLAQGAMGGYMDRQNDADASRYAQHEQAATAELLNRLSPNDGRMQAMGQGLAVPSLRKTIEAQIGQELDYPRQREQDALRIELEDKRERARMILADANASAAERRQAALFAQQAELLEKRLQGQKDLRSMPTIHISTGGSGNTPAGFAGAATVIGTDPRTDSPIYRATKSGELFRFDENGQAVPHQGAIAPKPVAPKEPTESERSSAGYLGRMQAAEQTIRGIKGGEATEGTVIAGKLPVAGGYIRRNVETPAQAKYRQAADDWIRAKLRKESGAVIGKDEMIAEYETYFPQPGDKPEVVAQKAQARAQAEQQLLSSAGRAKPTQAAPVVTQRLTPQQAAALPPGTKFTGLDGVERTKR